MILISHRGNLNGRALAFENDPSYVSNVLDLGYDCEIDLRYLNGEWFLGHDTGEYKVNFNFLLTPGLWIHCKNITALENLHTDKRINCFWHQDDAYTLTSQGFIWAYPGCQVETDIKTIAVMPELVDNIDLSEFGGICSDMIRHYV